MFFKEKAVKRIMFTLTVIITLLYINQEIYSSFVEGFYSFTVAGDFTAGLSFFSDYLTAIRFSHITYLVPMDIEYTLLLRYFNVLLYPMAFVFAML